MFPALDVLPIAIITLGADDLRTLTATLAAGAISCAFWRTLTAPGQQMRALPRGPAQRRFASACRRAVRSGVAATLPAFAVDEADARTYWDITLVPQPQSATMPAHLLVMLTDVTETVALRQALAAREDELRRRTNDLELLNVTWQAISSSLDLQTVLAHVLSSLSGVVEYDRASVAVVTEDGTHLRVVCDTASEDSQVGQLVPIAGSMRGTVFTAARPLHIAHVTAETLPAPPRVPLDQYPASMIIAPLIASDRPIGTLSVLSDTPGKLTAVDAARVTRITAQVAIAVANAQLYEEVRDRLHELRLLNADLAEANRHKSIFLATMSHELRTPLNAIIGFAELLADGLIEDPDDQRQSLEDIGRSGKHLLIVINDVLDIAKIEAGEMIMRPRAFTLASELEGTVRVMQALFSHRGQTFTTHFAPNLPAVYADPERTRQVVLHVLTNAHKFTPDGGTISLAADDNGAGDVEIRVTDTGIGIRPEDAALVWQEFRQLDISVGRRYEGAGLGLTLVQRLLNLMHGQIRFESEPGRGTTFFITLPGVREPASLALTGSGNREGTA